MISHPDLGSALARNWGSTIAGLRQQMQAEAVLMPAPAPGDALRLLQISSDVHDWDATQDLPVVVNEVHPDRITVEDARGMTYEVEDSEGTGKAFACIENWTIALLPLAGS